jgi:DNA adenine methylase
MKAASPLRYPGGKRSLASLLSEVIRVNRLGDRTVAEPFAGGAGASLSLLFHEDTTSISINDADIAIFCLWWSLIKRPNAFRTMLLRTPVSVRDWYKQRDIYRSQRISRLSRGFAAFYLNRCNRSGIIMNGGPIGGLKQDGTWKIDARFNKQELLRRCDKIAEYRDRIFVSNCDGLDIIASLNVARTFFVLDPPYFEKGRTVYLNALTEDYHAALAQKLKSMADAAWVLTYDDCPEIRSLYSGWANVRPFGLRYAAAVRRTGKELLITPRWMQLPDKQSSTAIVW